MDKSPVPVDSLTLRFTGDGGGGGELHELRAAHVAEVLEGLVGLASDFSKAGAFGHDEIASEVLVRPAQEGSFVLEVVRVVTEHVGTVEAAATALGVPPLGVVLHWATKSIRAEVQDFEHLENGNVKVVWQDETAEEIPREAWEELNKRKRRRKKQLRQIMAPLSDERVDELEVREQSDAGFSPDTQPDYTLVREDYDAVVLEDEESEEFEITDVEAQMAAIDFDDPEKWKVKTVDGTRIAKVEDTQFLDRVAAGLAIRRTDIFNLKVRIATITKNGRTRTKWTVLEVKGHRRAVHDDGA